MEPLRGRLLPRRIRRALSPSYGARSNAAQALGEIAAQGDEVVLHGSDLALMSGHPAGLSQRRVIGRLGTALWEVFPGRVALLDQEGCVVSVNRAWRQFGVEGGRSLTADLSTSYLTVLDEAAGAGDEDAAEAGVIVRAALEGHAVDRRFTYQAEHGRWFGMQVIPLPGRGSGALVVHTDVTADRESERSWRHRALHDPLTGLPNRALLSDRLQHAVAASARDPQSLAVLFVDLDSFKRVNDEHGHATGDRVLREAARRMAASVRTGDTIGRWGGDEFLVIAERLDHPNAAADLAERLADSLLTPIDTPEGPMAVRASIGLSHLEQHETGEQMVDAADQALQRLRERLRQGQPARAGR